MAFFSESNFYQLFIKASILAVNNYNMWYERLLNELSENYYSQVFLFVAEVMALVLGILYARKYKAGRLFIFYIAFDLAIMVIDWFLIAFPFYPKKIISLFAYITNTLVALVELGVYFYFFSLVITRKDIKKTLLLLFAFFFLIVLVYILTRFHFLSIRYRYMSYIIGALEFLLLIFPCIVYFRQALNNATSMSIIEKPSFWIVTGIFIFSTISIPAYLILSYIAVYKNILSPLFSATLYYVPFAINFLFLSKAFLCRKPLTI
ncbi:MAG TPA: hypothetical protein PKA77_12460 [Chitinophagaceae bacterium]|jgi:hypothetical protein|nr:hypothetical protein [Chitinophagaceae bacterium]HMU59130.1 hypothetical protein [Chitinophagaceae bacterium]